MDPNSPQGDGTAAPEGAAAPVSPAAPAPAAPSVAAPAPPAVAIAPSNSAAVTPQQPPAPTAWYESIPDPKLREYASRYTAPADIVSTTLKLREEVSQRVKPLGPNSTPEDIAQYRKTFGIPESPEQYQFTLPPDVTISEADKALLAAVLPIAYEYNVPAEALNKFVGTTLQLTNQVQREVLNVMGEYGKAQERALKSEWGTQYDANVQLAQRAAKVHGGDDFINLVNSVQIPGGGLLGDHPTMVKFLAQIGRRSDEGDLMIGSTKEERASAQQQLDDLNTKVPPGSAGYTTREHQAKLQQLYQQVTGSQPIVGSSGRAA